MADDPKIVDAIFKNFEARKEAILKALTTDIQQLWEQCDPAKENLCLYGHPDKTWEVREPIELVPTELPEPAMGINFARDAMVMENWIPYIATHSDVWLRSVAFYYIGIKAVGKTERERLFNMIDELPTLREVTIGTANKQSEGSSNSSSKKPESKSKGKQPMVSEEEEQGETPCGACGENYKVDEFWICCDFCDTWYHGQCVMISPGMAEHIDKYKCPRCNNKRARA